MKAMAKQWGGGGANGVGGMARPGIDPAWRPRGPSPAHVPGASPGWPLAGPGLPQAETPDIRCGYTEVNVDRLARESGEMLEQCVLKGCSVVSAPEWVPVPSFGPRLKEGARVM